MPSRISTEEFAELAGVSGGTVRSWARKGFPGAERVTSLRGTPAWQFDRRTAKAFAVGVRKVNEIFHVVGR